MHMRPSRWVPLLLWLAGCAAPGPTPPDLTEQSPAQIPEVVPESVRLPDEALTVDDRVLTAPRMLAALEHVSSLEPKAAKQVIAQQQGSVDTLPAGERFEFALLLIRQGVDERSLKRAGRLLGVLEADAVEPGVREVLRLQRHSLDLEQRIRMERRKSIELQKKIEHLKGLEQELDESNRRLEESLAPKPEPSQ